MAMTTLGQRCIWSARANLALGYGSGAEALAILDRLIATGANVVNQQDVPMLSWRRGRALAQLGLHTEAEEALLAARAGSVALGKLSRLWRIDLDLALCYQTLGRTGDVAQALRHGREVARQVADNIPDERLRAGFQSGAASLFDAIDGGSGSRRSRPRHAPLTPREADVVRCVARGLTNRQIAHTLSIGERTVETHVSNALGKLGFTSRAQLAAWVVEHDPARRADGRSELELDC
jgi:DNA-binding CsgD family transcriptional regulator